MHIALSGPLPEGLSLVIEKDTEQTPEQDQAGICHDWWNESGVFVSVS